MSKRVIGLLVFVGLFLLPVAAKADSVAWEYTSTVTSLITPPNNATLGVVFAPTVNIWVDYLGYFDNGGIRDPNGHAVGLYNSSGTLIAFTSITTSSSIMTTNFVFNSITPVELLAGNNYVLEGVSGTTDKYTNQTLGLASYLPISINGYNYQFNGGNLAYDNTVAPAAGGLPLQFFGANFGGYATPEPSSLLLLGSGLAGLPA